MEWFNPYGFVFVSLLMIPNIIFAIKHKDGFSNLYKNKIVELLEQIGRYGCIVTMAVNMPFSSFGFTSDEAFAIYLIVDSALILTYCLIWAICFRQDSVFRALSLSIIPSVVFLFSGTMSRSVLLTIMAAIFAPSHILVSYKNATAK